MADTLAETVDSVAVESGFSGVLRVDRPGEPSFTRAFGLADRAHGIAMTPDTRIAVASGGKTFTGLTVLGLVEHAVLSLDTTARSLLGSDLPILDGFPQRSEPGTEFRYNNGAFCVLAILAERAGGEPFHDLVRRLVIEPAGLHRTAYLRSDELPADAAVGYLAGDGLRTNVLHLPVVGGGDGGIFTTVDDVHRLWSALEAGEVISSDLLAEAWRTRSHLPDEEGYGLGFWTWGSAVELKGGDVGAALYSLHVPGGLTWTIMSNVTNGLMPLAGRVQEALLGDGMP